VQVSILATAATGLQFNGFTGMWSGTVTAQTLTLTMNSAATVIANFTAPQTTGSTITDPPPSKSTLQTQLTTIRQEVSQRKPNRWLISAGGDRGRYTGPWSRRTRLATQFAPGRCRIFASVQTRSRPTERPSPSFTGSHRVQPVPPLSIHIPLTVIPIPPGGSLTPVGGRHPCRCKPISRVVRRNR
jgi:hypothetical protein